MTPPEFSVLLLAWDDADPTVAVLGGAALPPTLPLVYQLAAQQPVLAVYPHLPDSDTPVASPPMLRPKPRQQQLPPQTISLKIRISRINPQLFHPLQKPMPMPWLRQ